MSSGKMVRWDDPEAVKIDNIFAHDIEAKMDDERIYIWPMPFSLERIIKITPVAKAVGDRRSLCALILPVSTRG